MASGNTSPAPLHNGTGLRKSASGVWSPSPSPSPEPSRVDNKGKGSSKGSKDSSGVNTVLAPSPVNPSLF
jgi:hypothetical protein